MGIADKAKKEGNRANFENARLGVSQSLEYLEMVSKNINLIAKTSPGVLEGLTIQLGREKEIYNEFFAKYA